MIEQVSLVRGREPLPRGYPTVLVHDERDDPNQYESDDRFESMSARRIHRGSEAICRFTTGIECVGEKFMTGDIRPVPGRQR